MTSDTTESHELPGHHWKDPDRVQEYVARMDRASDERASQLALLVGLIPFAADHELRLLDVGAGYGAVAAAVLQAFPNAQATLLDVSDEMIRVGGERMAPYAGRYRYVHGDFADGQLPADLAGDFDAIVSSLAIHHLPAGGKQALYADCVGRLSAEGCFFNLDIVGPPDHELGELYRALAAQDRRERGEKEPSYARTASGGHGEFQPLADHLTWLREAGLTHVDCFWKRLGMALFGGYKAQAGLAGYLAVD